MQPQRVVITGVGVISALGPSRDVFWQALSAGRSGIGPLTAVDSEQLRFKYAAEALDFQPEQHFEPQQLSLTDRFAQFALVAAREAVADARIEWTPELRERTAVVSGACVGGQAANEQGSIDVYRDNRRAHPLTVVRTMMNAGASHVSMEFGLTGPTFTLSTACASSTHAIGHAYWLVRHGLADLALAGGSEAPFVLMHLKAWESMRVVAKDTCRPFSRQRSGMILGEGGAMLTLEPLDAALERDAPIYAEIVGFGMSADAQHITQPASAGAARAIRAALQDGGLEPQQIGYINAHGTGTQANDSSETAAIRTVFGDHAGRLAVSSTKSMHGHALGAAGAIEAAATALALRHGVLPPTANFIDPDPECDLDVIPNAARAAEPEYALSNSFAFGGLNAVLAFRRWAG
jgi:nodulation protein E